MNELERLKERKNAIILAHNYQRPEVQDAADFVGDSLELSIKASKVDADMIVFAGTDFMAETAAILNPDKKVLIPDRGAVCPMASQLLPHQIEEMKRRYPDAEVVLYVNTLASAKACADVICTSANADKVVNSVDSDTVIFGPDRNLAYYVSRRTEKEIVTVPEYGICPTHHQITMKDLQDAKENHPDAEVVVHPECIPEVQDAADHIASTSGMIRYCKNSDAREFIIGTEIGLLHRLRKECGGKKFHPISQYAVCPQMKMHTLEKIERCLKDEENVVEVDPEISKRAADAVKRMLEIVS